VLTILLAIALTFFTVSRLELKTVTNIENTVRAELLANAALNIGISFLSQDAHDHPTVTSLDHAWRTYFNGVWIQGKLWAFPRQQVWNATENAWAPFAGLVDVGTVPTIFFAEDTRAGLPVPGGGGIGHLYVPRYEVPELPVPPSVADIGGYRLDANPYVIDPEGQRVYDGTYADGLFPLGAPIPAAYQVERWADVDNDGDGLRDSMWIPLASDVLVGNTVDSETHEVLFPGDGVDNDLDERDPTCCPCQVAVDGSEGTDEPDETAVFLYNGTNDGLDNDNINTDRSAQRYGDDEYWIVDGNRIDRWFLTAPICSLDAAKDFYLTLHNVCIPGLGTVNINTDPLLPWPENPAQSRDEQHRWVDVLDNDYDLVHNKHFEYYTAAGNWMWPTTPPYNDATIYPDPVQAWNLYIADTNTNPPHPPLPIRVVSNSQFEQLPGLHEISPRYLDASVSSVWRVKSTGEPVSEIVGRAAILINDEASKVNVNVAGGNTLEIPEITKPGNSGPTDVAGAGAHRDYWTPATASAASTSQYCTRVLPQTGASDPDSVGRARKLWNLRMGAPNGGLEVRPADGSALVPLEAEYIMDAFQPGYGLVDDNANSLMLAMNGIDDDGDGMIDEGVNPAYPEYLGLFEGVDEPDEFQRLNPYRNLVAEGKILESDGTTRDEADNDRNGATNERGELGDRPLRTREEVKRAVQTEAVDTSGSYYDLLRDYITLHSTDKNNRFMEAQVGSYKDDNGYVVTSLLLQPTPFLGQGSQIQQGMKVDYNYATANSIAQAFIDDWSMASATRTYGYPNAATVGSDPETAALAFATGLQQEGVTVALEPYVQVGLKLFRSPIHFEYEDPLGNYRPLLDPYDLDLVTGLPRPIAYPADPELRAKQLAANVVDGRDTDYARTTETMTVKDTWWEGESGGQQRNITYTVAGCEGIRITEMMVRPVRRVEAEMTKFLANNTEQTRAAAAGAPQVSAGYYFCPNILVDGGCLYASPASVANLTAPYGTLPSGEYLDFDADRAYAEETIRDAFSAFAAPPPPYGEYSLAFDDFPDATVKPYPPIASAYWYRDSQVLPQIGGGDGVIGPDSVLSTAAATIPIRVYRPDGSGIYDVQQFPNIIQFKFGPGPGLPPGKYYLTVNTTTSKINPATGRPYVTVDQQDITHDQLRFAVKYAVAGASDILFDVYSEYFDPALGDSNPLFTFMNENDPAKTGYYWRQDPIVSYKRYGDFDPAGHTPEEIQEAATGWVFLPPIEFDSAATPPAGYRQDEAFTVTIPPYADTAADQVYLYVALWVGESIASAFALPEPLALQANGLDDDNDGVIDDGPNGRPQLSINFFDFSQEPDHEWVEIENVTGHPVDISGWTLTVGGVDKEGNVVTKDRVDMQIPDTMTLNPNNPVILESRPPNNRVILAVDVLENQGGGNILMKNGMGLVGMDMTPVLGPDLSGVSSPKPSTFNPWAWPELDYPGNPYGLTPNGIDDDGDGVIDDGPGDPAGSPEAVALQANGIDDDNDGFIDDSATSPGISVFDNMYAARRVVQVEIEGLNAGTVTSVNDVAKWVLRGGVFPDYPEHDGIDNDYDNSILSTDRIDNNGDGYVDEPNEGIDEGRYLMDTKEVGGWAMPPPGGFNYLPVRLQSDVFPQVYNELSDPTTWREYLGAPGVVENPPEWKEFVERRFFPGDNVVVTLFEGTPTDKRVVDRVTYTERDVINRSIDEGDNLDGSDLEIPIWHDSVGTPYHGRATLYERASGTISGAYLTFWPDNTMMLDFYRTLERKHHPLYNGDRFGTSNRWEATDGNYDDWSHSPVALNSPNFNGTPLVRNDVSNDPAFLVTAPNPALMNPEEVYLGFLSHALGDAPLDDFSGSVVSDNWAVNTGAWNLADGALETNAGLIHYQGPPLPRTPTLPTLPYRENDPRDAFRWRNYQFTCDFKPLQSLQVGSVIGFVFRYGTDGNTIRYYRVQVTLEPDGSTWYRIVKHWGGAHDVVLPLVERAGPPLPVYAAVPDGQSPLLSEVRVEGNRISAIVNGVVLMTADTDSTYPVIADGSVGFYCAGIPAGGGVAFDNVYVTTRERNRPYTSPEDALAQPYLAFNRVFNYDSMSGEFSMGNDGFSPVRDVLYMTEPQPVEPPRGLRMGDSYPLDVNAVVSTAATDRVLLTCGQANFHLLYPTSAQFPLNPADWAPLLNWTPPTQPGQPWGVPQVWRPAFMYALREPSFAYKYRIEGADLDLTDQSPYTAFNFLFISGLDRYNNVAPGDPLAWLAPNGLLSRYGWNEMGWRRDPRIVMYVSGNLDSFHPTDPRPDPASANRNGAADATEALFEWNAEDGLENGQYNVYLDMGAYAPTFRDGDRVKLMADGLRDYGDGCHYYTNPQDRRSDTGLLTPLGQALYGVRAECGITADQTGLFETWRPEDMTVDVEMFTDEDGDGQCWSGAAPTWNNLNRGTESFGQQQGLAPGPDGYIHYGVVRVKNNYLALHLRNWTKPGIPNRFLGVILTPRDRTSGRININTVETKAYWDNNSNATRLFNALMGVPGVLFDNGQQYIEPNGAPTPPRLQDLGLTDPGKGGTPPIPPVMRLDFSSEPTNLFDRARFIEVGRPGTRLKTAYVLDQPLGYTDYPHRQDGRYYTSLSELLSSDSEFWATSSDVLHPLTTQRPQLDMSIGKPFPDNPQWNNEIGTRFGKMANLITTRSDVFEILVTVQAGYAVDANGDGQINWRSNDEFIVTAEKKARSVYER
jgi:hypothetical protein